IQDSTIDAGGDVELSAEDDSTITAQVGGLSVEVAASFESGGAAIGVAKADNLIGYNSNGTADASQVQGYIQDSAIAADGDLSLSAHDTATIEAHVFAASVALSFGAIALGGAGAGATTQNRIKTLVKAYIDGTDPDTVDDDNTSGITADGV